MSIKKIKSKRLVSKHKLKTKTKKQQTPKRQISQYMSLQPQKHHQLHTQLPHTQPHKHQSILDIINYLSLHRNNLRKSQNNLPAHLMKLKSTSTSSLRKPEIQKAQQAQHAKVFTNSFSKSMSSSFSTVTKNGETHNKGKTVINNSTQPFIEIKEIENNNVKHYMVPKNTIPYKSNLILANKSKKYNQKKLLKTKKSKYLKIKKFPKTKKSKNLKTKKSPKTKKSSKTKKSQK